MDTIAQTVTRPLHDNRLALEITMLGGVAHHYEISAEPFYRALAEILRTEKPPRVVVDPQSPPPSTFAPGVASPS